MNDFWWFMHITGIVLWMGVTAAGLIAWPTAKALRNKENAVIDIRTLVILITRTSYIGAGLAAVGGFALSWLVQPKSELGAFWLETMQGLGVVAFVISIFVLTRLGKHLQTTTGSDPAEVGIMPLTRRYRTWLVTLFIMLLICLVMAAFKPLL